MSNLKKEYTDLKNITHKIEHFVVDGNDRPSKEMTIEALYNVLTKQSKRVTV